MFNSKSEIDRLITAGTADEKKLSGLQKKFRDLEPRWSELQGEAEALEAQRLAEGGTYRRQVSEEFWTARNGKLKAAVEEVCVRRDELTSGICKEIAELKAQIRRRNSALISPFVAWSNQIILNLPDDSPRRAELMAARRRCEEAGISEIVSIIESWADRIAAEPSTSTPLFRTQDAVAAANAAV